MADNVVANSGTGGATFATDDIGGVHYPITKVGWGALDTANILDDAAGKRLPVKVGEPLSTQATATWDNTTAVNTTVSLAVKGYGSATISYHKTGNLSAGTLIFEASGDGGTSWSTLQGILTSDYSNSTTISASGTSDANYLVPIGGITDIRVRLQVVLTDTGSATLTLTAAHAGGSVPVQRMTIAGSIVTINTTSTGTVAHDGVGTAVNPVIQAGIASAAAPADVSADGDVVRAWRLRNGAQATVLTSAGALIAGDATNGLDVDVTRMPDVVLAAGTNTNEVVGDAADDAVAAGNPLSMGLTARQTNRTAVADGDAVRAVGDDMGRQVVVLNQVRDLVSHQHTQIASSSAETTIVTAVASTFCDLVGLVITNQTATAVNVTIKDATAGTTRMILALAASGGIVLNFPVPVTQAAVNNNWTATLSSAAVTVNIFAQFVKNV